MDHDERDVAGLWTWNGFGDLVGHRYCLQQGDGYERDALGDRQPDDPDLGHRPYDHRGTERDWHLGTVAQGDDQHVSIVFSSCGGDGQRVAKPGCDDAGSDADMACERSANVLETAVAGVDALSIHLAEGGDGGLVSRSHRR